MSVLEVISDISPSVSEPWYSGILLGVIEEERDEERDDERDDDEQADELAQEDAYHHWVEGGKEH